MKQTNLVYGPFFEKNPKYKWWNKEPRYIQVYKEVTVKEENGKLIYEVVEKEQ